MPDTGKDPHQSCGTVASGRLAVCVHGGQVPHVGAGVLAIGSALVHGRLVLEVRCVMTEQNAILYCCHRKYLLK